MQRLSPLYCGVCRANKHGPAVPGEGNPDADIMFVGEALGKLEAASGRPYVGRYGNLLRSLNGSEDYSSHRPCRGADNTHRTFIITVRPADASRFEASMAEISGDFRNLKKVIYELDFEQEQGKSDLAEIVRRDNIL